MEQERKASLLEERKQVTALSLSLSPASMLEQRK
jgi:hypothetical protein